MKRWMAVCLLGLVACGSEDFVDTFDAGPGVDAHFCSFSPGTYERFFIQTEDPCGVVDDFDSRKIATEFGDREYHAPIHGGFCNSTFLEAFDQCSIEYQHECTSSGAPGNPGFTPSYTMTARYEFEPDGNHTGTENYRFSDGCRVTYAVTGTRL